MASIYLFDKFVPSIVNLIIESVSFLPGYVRIGVDKRVDLLDEQGVNDEFLDEVYYYDVPVSLFDKDE